MTNESRMTIMYEKDRGRSKMKLRKRWQSQPLMPRKVMLCVRWDWKEIVHYELLPPSQTIDSNLYCQQLERLRQATRINQ